MHAQSFTRYGFLDGLESETVVHINQDHEGKLWVATLGGGLSSFDGLKFENYTVRRGLAHNFVMNVFCQGDTIYAVNDLGISILLNKKFFTPYSHQVTVSAFHGGVFYFKNQNGELAQLKNGVFSIIKFKDSKETVESMEVLPNGVIVLTNLGSLYELQEEQRLHKISSLLNGQVVSYQGYNVWIGKGSDYMNRIIVFSNERDYKERDEIRQVLNDSEDRTWIIKYGKLFLQESKELIPYSKLQGFTDSEVNYLFNDREGLVWVATNDGLYRISRNTFKLAGSVKSQDKINAITMGSKLIVATDRGEVWGLKEGTFSPWSAANKSLRPQYRAAWVDSLDNSIWLGTANSGIVRVDEDGVANKLGGNALAKSTVHKIYKSKVGDIWIGTSDGLVKKSHHEHLINSNLPDKVIWGIEEQDDGTIILLTRGGIYYLRNGIVLPSNIKEISKKRVTCFVMDSRKNFWIGTLGFGLIRADSSGVIKEITTDSGLNSDVIVNLAEINEEIYVGTFRGIDRISIGNDGSETIRHLASEVVPTNFGSFFYQKSANTLWFGSNEKLLNYKIEKPIGKSPLLKLDRVYLLGNSSEASLSNEITLSYSENNLRFEFLGLSLSNPQEVTYSTRLIGWDPSWTKPSAYRIADYTNLPPGPYRFEVVATNSGSEYSNSVSFDFKIEKPFWQNLWFVGICILSFSAMVMVIYGYRLNHKLKAAIDMERNKQEVLDRVRKTIARDFHDSMGNKLAGIKLYSHLVSLKVKDVNKDIYDLLLFIEKNAQELFEGTKDFIWSIDPDSDNLIEVYTYIKDFGEEYFKLTNIKFYSEMISEKDFVKIPSGWSRQMVLIFKEAMTNAAKHSTGNRASFSLEVTNENFVFIFSDNGASFINSNHMGKGIKNMTSRANAISCELTLDAENLVEIRLSGKLS